MTSNKLVVRLHADNQHLLRRNLTVDLWFWILAIVNIGLENTYVKKEKYIMRIAFKGKKRRMGCLF